MSPQDLHPCRKPVTVRGLGPLLGIGLCLLGTLVGGCTRTSTDPDPLDPQVVPRWTSFAVNSDVHALAFEGNILWVGTEGGLLQYDLQQDRVVARYTNQNGLRSNYIYCIVIEDQDNKWIGTLGGGLARFDGKTWKIYRPPELADPFVYDLLWDREGHLWVATWSGVSVQRRGQWQTYTTADGLVDDWVYALAMDQEGRIWMGTEGGITRYDGKTWVSYTHEDGLGAPLEVIGEFTRLYNPSIHHRTEPGKEAEGYNPNYVIALAVDHQGRIWAGTWGAGLSVFDGKTWKTYTTRDGLAGNTVTDLYVDPQGHLWATTDGGVSVFNGRRWRRYTTRDGLIADRVYTIAVDAQGHPWFGTILGISKLEGFERINPSRASFSPFLP